MARVAAQEAATPNDRAYENRAQSLAENYRKDVARTGAQGHAKANLAVLQLTE
jgi:hypothetical protein